MSERRALHYEGQSILGIVADILEKHGYTDAEWGYAKDGAAGWAAWYYWIDISEDPARPVEAEIDAALARR